MRIAISCCVLILSGMMPVISPACKTRQLQKDPPPTSQFDFEKSWKMVDSLESSQLYKSALEETELIRNQAVIEKNDPQLVKSAIYLNKYTVYLNEEGLETAIMGFEDVLEQSEQPAKSILYSYTAELYRSYLRNHLWELRDRTNLSGTPGDDLRTWDISDFIEKINRYYVLSVEDPGIKSVPVSDYDDILTESNTDHLRPTLFDLLAFRAIDHFSSDHAFMTRPVDAYVMTDVNLLSQVDDFIAYRFTAVDSAAYEIEALKLYQSVLTRHLEDGNEQALIDTDLRRLNFAFTTLENEEKAAAYLSALSYLEQTYPTSPMVAEVGYRRAEFYSRTGDEYSGAADDPHRYDLKKAVDICNAIISKYPGTSGQARCSNLIASISYPTLSVQTERVIPSKESILINIEFKNVEQVEMRVVRVDYRDRDKLQGNSDKVLAFLNGLNTLQSMEVTLPLAGDYRNHDTEVALNSLPYGFYALLISDGGFRKGTITAYALFHVSDLAYWNYSDSDTREIAVVDRISGAPIEGVKAEFFTWQYNSHLRKNVLISQGTELTDGNGLAEYHIQENRNSLVVKLTNDQDVLFLDENVHAYYQRSKPEARNAVYLFTDRSIYRPGQTIYFKGYLVNVDRNRMPSILNTGNVTVTFKDVNGQDIASQELKPNTFGTFSGEFIAPQGRLLGSMQLVASGSGKGSTNIQVEEYKRPTFEVSFDPASRSFDLGAIVRADGKALTYAGVPLDRATVQYRVVRRTSFPWVPWWRRSWMPSSPDMIITTGSTTTDAVGRFTIEFEARGDHSASKHKPEFSFEVVVDVTDVAGETRSTTKSIILAEQSFRVIVGLGERIAMQSLGNIRVFSTNLNGEPVSLDGNIEVARLDAPSKPFRDRYWDVPDTLLLSEADYIQKFPEYAIPGKEDIASWNVGKSQGTSSFAVSGPDSVSASGLVDSPGAYEFKLHFKADNGDTASVVYRTIVYDNRGILPSFETFADMPLARTLEPGQSFDHALISSQPLFLRYYTDRQSGIRREWIELQDHNSKIINIEERDRGGFRVHGIFVFNNRVRQFQHAITVPWSNKEVDIKYLSYRDKTEPGSQEEWHLKLSGSKKEGMAAEMLATMYDASLDAFLPHNWELSLYPAYRGEGHSQPIGFTVSDYRYLDSRPYASRNHVENVLYRQFKWFDFPMYGDRRVMMRGDHLEMAPGQAPPQVQMIEGDVPDESVMDLSMANKLSNDTAEESITGEDGESVPPAIRSDLRETVFFNPHIESDQEGNITIKFKMNESLTRWKFLALAHTKDLKYGLSTQEIVTQKDLMVFPHMPRFLRQKDVIILTAKVHNMLASGLSGSAELKILDAATENDVTHDFGLINNTVELDIPAEGSAGVDWEIKVPDTWTSIVKYQVIARAGNKGDGEEGILPVLSDRIFVTETMAMHVPAKTERTFVFDALKNNRSTTLEHQGYTVEFTSNPAWLAVQSLPYLDEYPHQCAEQVWNRLYANQIARKIVTTFPEIGATYRKWTEDPNSVSLMSNLSKNQELKSALLEETPWVRDAMSEEEQMRNIANLLDGDRISTETAKAVMTLSQMQLSNGGFPWFPGGRDNRYVTQYLLEGAGHLNKLEAIDPAVYNDLMKIVFPAVDYIDARLLEEYNDLAELVAEGKAKWEDDHLSNIAGHYLYARSFFRSKQSNDAIKKARDYYLGQAEKYWNKRPLYVQSLLALALHRWDGSAVVKTMQQSFEERALFQDELGRYWKENRGFYWYELPIERQALMIELFEELGADQSWIDELRLWLLTNKQTNRWTSTKSTAAAVYALLMQEDNWLEGVQVAIMVAGNPLDDHNPEAGSGYVKVNWQAPQVNSEQGTIEVINPNAHVAWGGAYWQYFEDMDKVEAAEGTPLKLRKSLHKRVSTDSGLKLVSLDEVNVGDELISRIEIEVDRDMEFIHLKDMRASGLEPVNVLSQFKWQGGLGYYESTGDLATNFFIDRLPRGKYIFEYPVRVAHAGSFSNGIATLQCMYAPEFSSHSGGLHVEFDR